MNGLHVGERLRAIRRQKGLSLHDVEARSATEFKASVLGAYERGERAISVPRLLRLSEIYDVPPDQLSATFDATHTLVLTTQDIPNRIENAPIVGMSAILTLDHLKGIRTQTIAFKLATYLQQHYFKDRVWLFPQLLAIVRQWLGDPDGNSPYVEYGDETFPGLLLSCKRRLRRRPWTTPKRFLRPIPSFRTAGPESAPRRCCDPLIR